MTPSDTLNACRIRVLINDPTLHNARMPWLHAFRLTLPFFRETTGA